MQTVKYFILIQLQQEEQCNNYCLQVRADLLEWKRFNEKYTSFIEPAISWMYGKYLQANQQPKGLTSYNEVIATLIAYYKKYGKM